MRDKDRGRRRLERFYGEMTSVDAIVEALGRDEAYAGQAGSGSIRAGDLYTRSLDCQNLGGFAMVQRVAELARERAALDGASRVLDVGCGVGGPGRYLADRFACSVTGIDLLPERIEAAAALTQLVGLGERVTYRRADATDLPFAEGAFDQAWMLDVGVHVTDKRGLFRELARVLRPQGLLVLHDHIGPLPKAMRPVTRDAPYIAPRLPRMLRHAEAAGLHVLLWHDTTQQVLAWMQERRPEPANGREEATAAERKRSKRRLAYRTAYVDALQQGMHTGLLLAMRPPQA